MALSQKTARSLFPNDDTDVFIYKVTARDAFGRTEGELYGNGLMDLKTYDNITGQLKRVTTGKGSKHIRDLNYIYDDMGDIVQKYDPINNMYDTFTYDRYNRLSSWNDGENTTSYSYDKFANLKNNSYNNTMIYNSKNQLTKRVNKDGKTYNFKYDKNGNMISDGDKSYTYTPFNKVKTIRYTIRRWI